MLQAAQVLIALFGVSKINVGLLTKVNEAVFGQLHNFPTSRYLLNSFAFAVNSELLLVIVLNYSCTFISRVQLYLFFCLLVCLLV